MTITREQAIDEMLSRRERLTGAQRASVARWPEQISIAVISSWPTDVSFHRIPDDVEYICDLLDPAVERLLSQEAVPVVAMPATYNMFGIEAAEVVAEFLAHMPGRTVAPICLCCDEVLLSPAPVLEEAGLAPTDLSCIRLRPDKAVEWSGEVPPDVEAILDRMQETEAFEFRRSYVEYALAATRAGGISWGVLRINDLSGMPFDEIEATADVCSFGHYRHAPCVCEGIREIPSSSDGNWLARHAVFTRWSPDPDIEFPMAEFELLRDATRIWRSVLMGKPGLSEDLSLQKLEKLGREQGIDSMVEALYAGVGIDDVLA